MAAIAQQSRVGGGRICLRAAADGDYYFHFRDEYAVKQCGDILT